MRDKDLFDLTNKIAIITGGGSGIGRRIALAFVEYGAKSIIADIDGKAADLAVAEIKDRGGEAIARRVDVTQPTEVQEMGLREGYLSEWAPLRRVRLAGHLPVKG